MGGCSGGAVHPKNANAPSIKIVVAAVRLKTCPISAWIQKKRDSFIFVTLAARCKPYAALPLNIPPAIRATIERGVKRVDCAIT